MDINPNYFVSHLVLSDKIMKVENMLLIAETKKNKGQVIAGDEAKMTHVLNNLLLQVEHIEVFLHNTY